MKQFVKVVDKLELNVKYISLQSGSQERNSLALLDKIAQKLSGGKAYDYIIKYCLMPKHSAILEKLLHATLKPIIQSAGKARDVTSNRDKPVIASLFTPHFSRNMLERMGLKLSNDAFAASNRHATKHGSGYPVPSIVPPSVLPAAKEAKEKLKAVCHEHSHVAANKLKNDEKGERQPVRILDVSKREVHRIFQNQHPTTPIPQSTFYKHVKSFKIFKPPCKAGTDMCINCLRGKHYQSELSKLLNRHNTQCPHALALRPFTALNLQFADVKLPSIPDCTCSIQFNNKEYIEQYIIPFLEHRHLNNQQRQFYDTQRKTVKAGEAVIVLDFKANIYVNRGPIEGSQDYFNHSQRSVLGMRIDWADSTGKHIEYFDFISTCLNHDAPFAIACLHHLILKKLQPKGIKSLSFWMDMAGHFTGREMTNYMLKFVPLVLELKTEVNHFVEHHGKSPVDAHFAHLSTWVNEMESRNCIMTTRQLIKELASSVASHAKGQRLKPETTLGTPAITKKDSKRKRKRRQRTQLAVVPADNTDKVSNVTFVEYRPACACHSNPFPSFFESWDDEMNVMDASVDALDHPPHSLQSSHPEVDDEKSVVVPYVSPLFHPNYVHDNHLAVPLNNNTSLSVQITRQQSCTTPLRDRHKMEITNYRAFYHFSASPPKPGQKLVVWAKELGGHCYPSHSVKYRTYTESKVKELKFAPKLPDVAVNPIDSRFINRMMTRKKLRDQVVSATVPVHQECVNMEIDGAEEISSHNIVVDVDNDVVMRSV